MTVAVRVMLRPVAVVAGALVVGGLLAGCTHNGDRAAKKSPAPNSFASPTPTSTEAALEDRMLENGVNQASQGRYDDATSTFKALLAIDPKEKYALYNLGLISEVQKDDAKAISYYKQALKVDPKYTPAMYNEAISYEPTNRPQAENLYQQIVKIDPKASTAFLRLSFLYRADGKTAQADQARDAAVALDGNLATVTPTPLPMGR